MSAPLNLATRPVRNEALPALLFGIAAVVLLGATAAHGMALKRLLSVSASARHGEVKALDAEEARLRRRIGELRPQRPDPKTLAQWSLLKELVDRRVFSWTTLLARLEELQPPGVRLQSIQPTVKKGEIDVDVMALVRAADDGLKFVKALEESPDFAEVYPLAIDKKATEDEGGGVAYHYTMRYLPQPRRPGAAKTGEAENAAPEADPSPGELSEEEQMAEPEIPGDEQP